MRSKRPAKEKDNSCCCGSRILDQLCCQPLLTGQRKAVSAAALMRSRYSAYVQQDEDYLRATWAEETCPHDLQLDRSQHWLGLKIVNTEAGLEGDDEGVVEFVARFKINGRGHRIHEVSRFQRRAQTWVYVDGDLVSKGTAK